MYQNCSGTNKNSFLNGYLVMAIDEIDKNSQGVDKGLVTMFLKMSPEERLLANDNAARTIQELRDAYKQGRNIDRSGFRRRTRGTDKS
jgi:hypothetical protein